MAEKRSTETPMMKQFFAVKAEHPEAVLLFRCGDFYETYGDDALIASKVLGIVLTKRSNAAPDSIPMAGFPYHSIETSRKAAPHLSLWKVSPAMKLCSFCSRSCSLNATPGVTSSVIPRLTIFLVSFGSSSWSHTATL